MIKREKVDFVIDNGKIVELFGVQNFAKAENAVLELVKNAYDAKAKSVTIRFTDNQIQIIDDGEGMDAKTIKDYWMHVGKSDKGYSVAVSPDEQRVLAGSKGIGRFAIARLGSNVTVCSRTKDNQSIIWETDWNEHFLSEVDYDNIPFGTSITITNTRDRWNEKALQRLTYYLGKCKNYNAFKIIIDYYGNITETTSPFSNISIGKNCLTKFEIAYDSGKKELSFSLESDEFDDSVQKIVSSCETTKDIDIHTKKVVFDVAKLLDKTAEFEDEDLNSALADIGDFVGNFYFNNQYIKTDREIFKYKRQDSLPSFNEKGFEIGVVLYRNAFCIAGYDGSDDWLGFGKRSRSSPAAPSHPTGMWRVRENQICGEVLIDKQANSHIEEMQNRQGITEDIYFRLFKAIIIEGIKAFEIHRQSIIRAIRKAAKPTDDEHEKRIDSFLKKPHSVFSMTPSQITKLAESFVVERTSHAKREKMLSEEIVNTKYDVRLLNTLSTIGLKSSWIAHDLNNEKRSMLSAPGYIVDSLIQYGYWSILNDEKHTALETHNIPGMLEKINKINKKVANFIDATLENVEKQKFDIKENQPSQIISNLCKKWKKDCSWIEFDTSLDDSLFVISEDIIETILNNLILNSIQQNNDGFSTTKKMRIDIKCNIESPFLEIEYQDHGKGLDSKYLSDPRKILEPHETTRKNGHGLGMWIVNNTVESSGGSILKISGNDGFYIKISIGNVYNDKN